MITQLIRAAAMADAATMPQRQISVQVNGAGVEVVGRVTTPLAGARTSTMIDWDTARCHPDSIITAVEMMAARIQSMTLPVLVDEVDDQGHPRSSTRYLGHLFSLRRR
jgi:hypothetical protein